MSKRRGLRWALISSLVVNLLLAGVLAVWIKTKGGIRYLGEKAGFVPVIPAPEIWQQDWKASFAFVPDSDDEIVFLGDSITASLPWAEFYSPILNRGIGGETAANILERLDEVIERKPKQVFINVGTNDISKDVPIKQTVDDVTEMVRRLRSTDAETEVFVCSVLPINLDVARDALKIRKQGLIPQLNDQLRHAAKDTGYEFIDLTEQFVDEDGGLRRALTTDGLHLSPEGKEVYAEFIKPYVAVDRGRQGPG